MNLRKIIYSTKVSAHKLLTLISEKPTTYFFKKILKKEIVYLNVFVTQFFGITRHNNLGDDLNIFIFDKLSKGKALIAGPRAKNPILAIGSIIETHTKTEKDMIIWGSGSMYGKAFRPLANLTVKAVRGPLTRNVLIKSGINCPEIYGDPALLLPIAYKGSVKVSGNTTSRPKFVIIPHYDDYKNPIYRTLQKELGEASIIINMGRYKSWTKIIDMIINCDFVISSSLHGLIIADAYNIPNLWISRNDLKLLGGYFKFRDYQLSVRPYLTEENINPFIVNETTKQQQIIDALKSWKPIKFNPKPLIDSCPVKLYI